MNWFLLILALILGNVLGQAGNMWQVGNAGQYVNEKMANGMSSAQIVGEFMVLVIPFLFTLAFAIWYLRWHGFHFFSIRQFWLAYAMIFLPVGFIITLIFVWVYWWGFHVVAGAIWPIKILVYTVDIPVTIVLAQYFLGQRLTLYQGFAVAFLVAGMIFAKLG